MIRAALIGAQPALAHFFHVRPWEIEYLTPLELDRMLTELEAMEREQRRTED